MCSYSTIARAWMSFGHSDNVIYNAYFHTDSPAINVLSTEGGIILNQGETWAEYTIGFPAPVLDVVLLDQDHLLLIAGGGQPTDGVYSFDLSTYAPPHLLFSISNPSFLLKNETDDYFYVGASNGFFKSWDGRHWVDDLSFTSLDCNSMAYLGGNFTLATSNGVYLLAYDGLPHFGDQSDLGIIRHIPINEASGIVASRKNENVFWTHNDSGGAPAIYAFNGQGEHLGVYTIDGVTNHDWEDLAIGPGPLEGEDYIYIGEIGDNNHLTEIKYAYRVLEPYVDGNQAPVQETLYGVEIIALEYPDFLHDCETLLVDPLTGDLFVVSKTVSTTPSIEHILLAAYPQSTTEINTMVEVGILDVPPFEYPPYYVGPVGGDISPLGNEILIKTYSHVFYWKRDPGQEIWETLETPYTVVPYTIEFQEEAICWKPDCNGYYTLGEEGVSPPIDCQLYYYERESWALAEASPELEDLDFGSDGVLYGRDTFPTSLSLVHHSTDYGETWAELFPSENISALGLDGEALVYVGWNDLYPGPSGVAYWNEDLQDLIFVNDGLPNSSINKIVTFPLEGTRAIMACTDSGAYYYLPDPTDVDNHLPIADEVILWDNYPNPFNPVTTIRFDLAEAKNTRLTIYSVEGKQVSRLADSVIEAGMHEVSWRGRDDQGRLVPSGVYFYCLEAGDIHKTKRMVLIR
jgi:hypothetical protein